MPRSDILENKFNNAGINISATTIEDAVREVATLKQSNYTLSTEVSGVGTSTAVVGQILLVNSTGARTVNPPDSPQALDRFMVVNSRANSTSGNNITISFASQLRHGSNTNRVINTSRGKAEFMYVNATIGWIDID